ncbi:hypothetical protein AB0D10_13660 [Kitasatospora sp. NPDC048545]|uniref:hypothetical protein n=1 Tax=Kitasatospora sp. NPDC048545 TaxID=3157208 RepID=UPI0033FE762A
MDAKGLPPFVTVTPADVTDRHAAKDVLFRLRLTHPEITTVRAAYAHAYTAQLVGGAKKYLHLTINTVDSPKDAKGFVVPSRRRVVGRSHARVMPARSAPNFVTGVGRSCRVTRNRE